MIAENASGTDGLLISRMTENGGKRNGSRGVVVGVVTDSLVVVVVRQAHSLWVVIVEEVGGRH